MAKFSSPDDLTRSILDYSQTITKSANVGMNSTSNTCNNRGLYIPAVSSRHPRSTDDVKWMVAVSGERSLITKLAAPADVLVKIDERFHKNEMMTKGSETVSE